MEPILGRQALLTVGKARYENQCSSEGCRMVFISRDHQKPFSSFREETNCMNGFYTCTVSEPCSRTFLREKDGFYGFESMVLMVLSQCFFWF
jgi:hypothetical protein